MHTSRFSWFALALSTLAACGGSPPPPAESPAPPVADAAEPAAPRLSLEVLTASPDGFLVTSTLITGEKEAVLIDAQFTLADAKAVAARIQATNKALTTVYVTHSHPDHYFGFPALKEAFPEAKLVALPATIADIEKTWQAKVKQWKPLYKEAITDQPIVPEPLAGNSIELEGEKLEIVGELQGDAAGNSYVWIPSLSTVVTGDLVYDQVFPWTAETTPETRTAWGATLDKLAALGAKSVVPGHQKPEQKQDPSNVQFTQGYLKAYDAALASSKTPEELQTKIKAQYPDAALDVVLKIGSEASLKPPAKTAKK
ncbi:MAG TPA: MBL fold metallo-hydrolase [Polyangiaceae bacterium]|nr:MBL fold metallo-hydrolase [Polyangiaceae bacterium]